MPEDSTDYVPSSAGDSFYTNPVGLNEIQKFPRKRSNIFQSRPQKTLESVQGEGSKTLTILKLNYMLYDDFVFIQR